MFRWAGVFDLDALATVGIQKRRYAKRFPSWRPEAHIHLDSGAGAVEAAVVRDDLVHSGD